MKQAHITHHDRVRTCNSAASFDGLNLPKMNHARELATKMHRMMKMTH
jgi:hypothetical protein